MNANSCKDEANEISDSFKTLLLIPQLCPATGLSGDYNNEISIRIGHLNEIFLNPQHKSGFIELLKEHPMRSYSERYSKYVSNHSKEGQALRIAYYDETIRKINILVAEPVKDWDKIFDLIYKATNTIPKDEILGNVEELILRRRHSEISDKEAEFELAKHFPLKPYAEQDPNTKYIFPPVEEQKFRISLLDEIADKVNSLLVAPYKNRKELLELLKNAYLILTGKNWEERPTRK